MEEEKPKKKEPWLTENLVLGWKVTKNLEPRYWSENKDAKPGDHNIDDVVLVAPETVGHHTVIIAQSGSGKSFFLGRLIEEILIKTRSRVLVLDTNSDFRKAAQTKLQDYWDGTKPGSRYPSRKAFLADEPSRAHFNRRWQPIWVRLHTNNKKTTTPLKSHEPLRLDWLKFPVDLLAEEAPEWLRDQVRHCHRVINLLAELASVTSNEEWLNSTFLERAETFCKDTVEDVKTEQESKIVDRLKTEFGTVKQTAGPAQASEAAAHPQGARRQASLAGILLKQDQITVEDGTTWLRVSRNLANIAGIFPDRELIAIDELTPVYERAATSRRFVTAEALKFYFGRAFELQTSGLVDPAIRNLVEDQERADIEVVDLPSIGDLRLQKMAICTFLEAEWAHARAELNAALDQDDLRVPTFIVVEEAHNIIPAKAATPIEKKLREEFRRIAAEGRKYGLFLILISQRPDKIDRMVMSECENRAVMKVGSSLVLRTTCEILGLEGVIPRMTDKVLDFELGRALLAGPWVADEPAVLVAAARRTEEGGRNLEPKHWARSRSP